jgi:integrase
MPAPLKVALTWGATGSTLLFPGKSGSFMNRDEYVAIYNDFDARLNALAGGTDTIRAVDRFTPGILRHNFATMMAEAGFAPKYLMEIMKHSSIEVTMKYYVHRTVCARKATPDLPLWSFNAESQVSQNSVNYAKINPLRQNKIPANALFTGILSGSGTRIRI